jgi:hypothetical protein
LDIACSFARRPSTLRLLLGGLYLPAASRGILWFILASSFTRHFVVLLASSYARHFVVYTCQQLHAAFCGFTCQQLRAAFCGCTCLQLRAAFSGLYLPAAWRGILWLYRLQLGAA